MSTKKRLFCCFFLPDVLCSSRKSKKFGIMDKCFECAHYREFMEEMAEEDAREADYVEKVRKYGWDFAERTWRRD